MLNHEQKIRRISTQLRERKSIKPISLKKKVISHEVPKPKDKKYLNEKIDISDLNEIITIDEKNLTCIAESGVTFINLVKETLKYNLVPIVVPELKTITIGGAVSGCSIESTSYRYGGFHDTCLEYEVITANGTILVCSPSNENSLLFQMIHGTFGTLGIITKLKFRLTSAKPFIKMNFFKYNNLEDYQAAILDHYERQDIDFMDGIIFSPTEYLLSLANFVDKAPYLRDYNWLRICFQDSRIRQENYVKTIDYFFRYDHGVTNTTPKSFLGRLFFGKLIGSSEILKVVKIFRYFIPTNKIPVTVDTFIPFLKMKEFMKWYKSEINFFPLWCIPYKLVRRYEWIANDFSDKIKDPLFLDIAIYGLKRSKKKDYYKLIEDKLMEINGLKTLISTNYYSEIDFWKLWNRENYYKIKQQIDPNNIFQDLYIKKCKN